MQRPAKPIASTLCDHPDYEERLQEFVFELGSRTDEYQDVESEGDFAHLLKLCDILARDSKELGYAALQRVALRVCSACEDGQDGQDGGPDTVHKATLDLTATVNRVRRGHRGAV
jgi:hypothetical protein